MSTARTRRLSALLVASALVLVSCGGKDSDSQSTGNRQRNAALTAFVRQIRTQTKFFDRNSFTNLALSRENEVIVWGSRVISGELLNPPVSRARLVALGNTQAIAIDLDNNFRAWGSNPDNINTPPADLDLSTVTSLSLDDGVVMAIDNAGKLWAWGYIWDLYGAAIPYEVREAKLVTALSANGQMNAALDESGVVHVWGTWNGVPAVQAAMSGVKAKNINLRNFTISVVTTDGKIIEAGFNPRSTGKFADVDVAVFAVDWWGNALAVDVNGRLHLDPVPDFGNLVQEVNSFNDNMGDFPRQALSVSATNARFTVLFDDGSFMDLAQFSEEGMDEPDYFYSSHMVSPITAGNYKSFVINDDYTITHIHQLQEGELAPPDDADFLAVTSGWHHALGLRKNGTVVSWGQGPDNNAIPETDIVREIGAGFGFSAVRNQFGQIISWGQFQSSTVEKERPLEFASYGRMSTGFHNIIAIGESFDGSAVVHAWGDNSYGQADVPNDLDAGQVSDVAIGYDCAAATLRDGSIRVWGTCEANEKNVPSGKKFDAIRLGMGLAVGITWDGELVAWGDNVADLGEKPEDMINILDVAVGTGHILAVDADGGIYGWGPNIWGETNIPESLKPLPVPDRYDDNYDDNLLGEADNAKEQIEAAREEVRVPPITDNTPISAVVDGKVVTVTPTFPTPPAIEPVNEAEQVNMTALPASVNPVTSAGKIVSVPAALKLLGLKKVTKAAFSVPKKVNPANSRVCSITKTGVKITGSGVCDVTVTYTDAKKKKRSKTLSLIGTP